MLLELQPIILLKYGDELFTYIIFPSVPSVYALVIAVFWAAKLLFLIIPVVILKFISDDDIDNNDVSICAWVFVPIFDKLRWLIIALFHFDKLELYINDWLFTDEDIEQSVSAANVVIPVDIMVDIVYIQVTIEFVMVAVNAAKFVVSFPESVNADGVFEP